MKRRAISLMMLTLLVTNVLTLASNIRQVKASGTIYIRADGSVDPPTAPISSPDNITYTFTDNIYEKIVVERDNIIVDGANYTIQGKGDLGSTGIYLPGADNVTISNMEIRSFNFGIFLGFASRFNIISGITIGRTLFIAKSHTVKSF